MSHTVTTTRGDSVAFDRHPAGLPGAEWWVAGPATTRAETADVELDEVERFCTDHDLWKRLV
jgi:hypothetical protein